MVSVVAVTVATAATGARAIVIATTGPTAPLWKGIYDPLFTGSQRTAAYAMAGQTGATYARLIVSWASVAPKTLPASGFDPTDPNSPHYDWSAVDASVSAANAAGITPIVDIVSSPSWAYAVKPGEWAGGSPKIADLGAFATAIATRYGGHDSAPAAHIFSVWNEPNYAKNLYPQNPAYYRSMVNAVADGVHGVDPSNLVLAGELAPGRLRVKDRNQTIQPIAFMRKMLCISPHKPYHLTCHRPAKFDVWAHHPYSNTGPFRKSSIPGSVVLGNLPEMKALLDTAEQLGAISSAHPVQLWATELGWSSNPPNTNGVPMGLESRWMSETLYQIWRSEVPVGIWFLLQDMPLTTPFQSGLYLRSSSLANSVAKPLLTAFSFPFVAYLTWGGKVQIWGCTVTSKEQRVTIQSQAGDLESWQTVAIVTSNRHGIFQATLPIGAQGPDYLRAGTPSSGTSLPFAVTPPRNENRNVVPFPSSS